MSKKLSGDWTGAAELATLVAGHVDSQDNKGPVVVVGHSFGAAGAVDTVIELKAKGMAVDLLVLMDAVHPGAWLKAHAAIVGSELQVPGNVKNLVHIAAADEHLLLKVSKIAGSAVEYEIGDTAHTNIDNTQETESIIRHLMSLLPAEGANAGRSDYFVPKFPVTVDQFPRDIRATWNRTVTVRRIPAE